MPDGDKLSGVLDALAPKDSEAEGVIVLLGVNVTSDVPEKEIVAVADGLAPKDNEAEGVIVLLGVSVTSDVPEKEIVAVADGLAPKDSEAVDDIVMLCDIGGVTVDDGVDVEVSN